MRVKRFPTSHPGHRGWWEQNQYHLPNDVREMLCSVNTPTMHDNDPKNFPAFEESFGGCTEYFTAAYSDYGGDIIERLICDGIDRIFDKKESDCTEAEMKIRRRACFGPSYYHGREVYVWDKDVVADLKKLMDDLYAYGDYIEAVFGGLMEDALTELEQKLYDKEWDYLVESYPDLKGDAELEESVRLWLEGCGNVMATTIDYSEPKLMGVIGSSLVERHCKYSTTDEPLPFYWLYEEREKAIGDAEQLQAGDYRNTVERQICDAYDYALQELGYAYAKGDDEVKDFVETNRNLGWLPWNKHED